MQRRKNGQSELYNRCSVLIAQLKDKHETFGIKGLCLLIQDRQTDGQNNVKIRCAYVIGIFTKKSSIAAEKIISPQQRYGLTDGRTPNPPPQSSSAPLEYYFYF